MTILQKKYENFFFFVASPVRFFLDTRSDENKQFLYSHLYLHLTLKNLPHLLTY